MTSSRDAREFASCAAASAVRPSPAHGWGQADAVEAAGALEEPESEEDPPEEPDEPFELEDSEAPDDAESPLDPVEAVLEALLPERESVA